MAAKEFIEYTEKEQAALEVLLAHRGARFTAKELGVPSGTLTSLVKKGVDPRPMKDGLERYVVNKEAIEDVCPTCGNVKNATVYWID